MNRSGFIKSLFALPFLPSMATKLASIQTASIATSVSSTSIFNDLNFVIPEYLPLLIEKYGNTSWMLMIDGIKPDES